MYHFNILSPFLYIPPAGPKLPTSQPHHFWSYLTWEGMKGEKGKGRKDEKERRETRHTLRITLFFFQGKPWLNNMPMLIAFYCLAFSWGRGCTCESLQYWVKQVGVESSSAEGSFQGHASSSKSLSSHYQSFRMEFFIWLYHAN